MKHSDFPSLVSRSFLAYPRDTAHASVVRSRWDRCPSPRAGVVSCRGFPNRVSVSGKNGTSQVPGEPPCRHAPLFDPGGTFKPGRLGFQVLPSGYKTTSAPTLRSFRGSITRPACSLSTLRSLGRPTTTQDSVPAAGQLCRGRLATPWVPLQGFRLPMSYLPPCPSFAWRTFIRIGIKSAVTSSYEIKKPRSFVCKKRGINQPVHIPLQHGDTGWNLTAFIFGTSISQIPFVSYFMTEIF